MSPFMYYAMPFIISSYIVSICYIVFYEHKGIRNFYNSIKKVIDDYETISNHPVNPIIRILTIAFLITFIFLFSPVYVMLS